MRREPRPFQARQEERLEAILQSVADGMVVTDPQRRIVALHGSLRGLSAYLGHFCGDISAILSAGEEGLSGGVCPVAGYEGGPSFLVPDRVYPGGE